MSKNQNTKEMSQREKMIEKYLEYANTEESFAVLFVKKYLKSYSNRYWVDINSVSTSSKDSPKNMNARDLEFEEVVCTLYVREERPVYPDKIEFIKSRLILPYEQFLKLPSCQKTLDHYEKEYLTLCRAITWDVSHDDITYQKHRGVKGISFQLTGKKIQKKTTLEKREKSLKTSMETPLFTYKITSVKRLK